LVVVLVQKVVALIWLVVLVAQVAVAD